MRLSSLPDSAVSAISDQLVERLAESRTDLPEIHDVASALSHVQAYEDRPVPVPAVIAGLPFVQPLVGGAASLARWSARRRLSRLARGDRGHRCHHRRFPAADRTWKRALGELRVLTRIATSGPREVLSDETASSVAIQQYLSPSTPVDASRPVGDLVPALAASVLRSVMPGRHRDRRTRQRLSGGAADHPDAADPGSEHRHPDLDRSGPVVRVAS
ncbi:MAG: hypothetical protein R2715_22295 [Ilumatobacteraceae bacterium]